jgi:hypothetical protein
VPAPQPVNLTIKLNPTRRRAAKSLKRLLQICLNSDAKLYARNPPKAFLPILPLADVALQAAVQTVIDQMTFIINQ